MRKIILLICGLAIFSGLSYGQSGNIIYIVDSIPIMQEPSEEESDMGPDKIDNVVTCKNKDSLRLLGYDNVDVAIFIFTKAYISRSDEIKRIPNPFHMLVKEGKTYLRGSNTPYTGPFIEYYYSGIKKREGAFSEGLYNGPHIQYFNNGVIAVKKTYKDGMLHGAQLDYYTDGTLRQKGENADGKEEGVWELYFPNGAVKRHCNFEKGKMEGESIMYYSTGKIHSRTVFTNGDPEVESKWAELGKLFSKGSDAGKKGNHKQAYKHYTKCIELDSNYVEAWFARGTAKLNERKIEEGMQDLDKALQLEPYHEHALFNRAYSRILLHQTSRTVSSNQYATIMIKKGKDAIPAAELAKLCADLHLALLIAPKMADAKKLVADYCK